MDQKAFSFDGTTLVKILKGALLSACGAGAVAFLQAIGSADLSKICVEESMWVCNGFILPGVAFTVPSLVNSVKEYIKGN